MTSADLIGGDHRTTLVKVPTPVEQPADDSADEKKPFRITRRRLGSIQFLRDESQYGFIQAEDYRDDVFFHFRDWDGQVGTDDQPRVIDPAVDMWVEFELDDEHFAVEKKLRAKVVRPSNRPEGKRLTGRDATFKLTQHHPNAKRKRPSWRDK